MKFLCVPCDSPMTLQSVGDAGSGSLSVIYACPACGYETAMLTNAYETQIVQSLGVRIGPAGSVADGTSAASGKAAGCPFAAMVGPRDDGARPVTEPSPGAVRWTAGAEARLQRVPDFVRPMARAGIEQYARDNGCGEVDEATLDAAREHFGM